VQYRELESSEGRNRMRYEGTVEERVKRECAFI
jgi:hypothetical protein